MRSTCRSSKLRADRDPYTEATTCACHSRRRRRQRQAAQLRHAALPTRRRCNGGPHRVSKRLVPRHGPRVSPMSVLHFATIVAPDADPLKRQGVLDVLTKFFEDKNHYVRAEDPRLHSSRRMMFKVRPPLAAAYLGTHRCIGHVAAAAARQARGGAGVRRDFGFGRGRLGAGAALLRSGVAAVPVSKCRCTRGRRGRLLHAVFLQGGFAGGAADRAIDSFPTDQRRCAPRDPDLPTEDQAAPLRPRLCPTRSKAARSRALPAHWNQVCTQSARRCATLDQRMRWFYRFGPKTSRRLASCRAP